MSQKASIQNERPDWADGDFPSSLIDELASRRGRFLAFVRQRVSDPELAEDILQSSLLKAVESLPQLRDDQRLLPWFYSILRNNIVDAYRRTAREGRRAELDQATELPDEMDAQASHIICACFEALIPSLKPEYRDILQTLDLEQRPTDEAAQQFGLTATNLKVRRHRARQALRLRLEETCRVCAEHHCLDCTCQAEATPA